MSRLSQWFVITLLLLGFFGGYFWYRSKAGTTTNAPETTNNTLTTGLLGHWTFDAPDISGTTATDRGTGGHNGTITGIGAKVAGRLGQALDFNGTSDYVALGTSLDISAKPFSLSVWVYRTDDSGYGTLIAKRDSYSISDMRFSWALGISASPGVHFQTPTTDLLFSHETPLNTWEFLTVVVESSATRLYVNGILNETLGSFTLGSDATAAVRIGSVPGDGDNFAGRIDDPRIYTRALSASEVYQLSTAGTATVNASLDDPLSQGLRGYWKLDEGTGTSTTADASGNANTLTMTNLESGDWQAGYVGPSTIDFDGVDEYLTIASPSSALDFPVGANFTLTGWFNRDLFAADHTILSSKSAQTTSDGYILWIDNNASNDYLNFRADENGSTDAYSLISATNFSATGWHHFAVSWNESAPNALLYIDGAVNGSVSGTAFASMGDLSNANPFSIGAETDGGNPFDGKLDDIRVYGSALSASEVAKLYQTTAPAQPVDTGLVGHWTFDGPDIQGTTAIDRSSFGNNGAITGATKTIGKLGQGLSFDGSGDYVNAGDTSSLNLTSSFSISFWVNGNSFPGGYYYQLLSKGSRGAGSYFLLVDVANYSEGDQRFRFGFTSGGSWSTVDSTTVVATGTWWHIAGVFDDSANTLKVYVNEALAGTSTGITSVPGSTTGINLTIGAYYNGDYEWINGKIDDVRLYNRALSVDEVSNLYDLGK